VSEVRSVRAELNVPAGAKVPLLIKGASQTNLTRLENHMDLIVRQARLEVAKQAGEIPEGAVQTLLDEATLILPLADIMDLDKERARLAKEIAKVDGDIGKIDAKLANEKFLSRAPAHVIEEQKTRKSAAQTARTQLVDALTRLQGAG
jgi:valyl-tRNA synthetase